jgi:hypothetical protein
MWKPLREISPMKKKKPIMSGYAAYVMKKSSAWKTE